MRFCELFKIMDLGCTLKQLFSLGERNGRVPLPLPNPSLNKGVVTNYGEGGATKREGGAREVLPLRKGGAEKVLAILKGGHKKFWGTFYVVA